MAYSWFNHSPMIQLLRIYVDCPARKKREAGLRRLGLRGIRIVEIGRSGCATICSSTPSRSRNRRSTVPVFKEMRRVETMSREAVGGFVQREDNVGWRYLHQRRRASRDRLPST